MSVTIESPYTIATLPKPLDTKHGKVQAAPVYSLRGSKKRKRHELAAGVDGETVNIYNVQNQSLVTSYAIPSHSYLCCPPCSIYKRRSQTSPAQRRTYLVLRDGLKAKDRRLVSFTEELQQDIGVTDELQAPTKKESRLESGEVASVEIVPRGERTEETSTGWDVLVTYANGYAVARDDDLKPLWEHGADTSPACIEYMEVLDLDSARKGLLKERDDVWATLGTNGSMRPTAALCCRILHREASKSRELQLLSVKARPEDAITTFGRAMEVVMSYDLPVAKYRPETPNYDLHAQTGKLCVLQDSHVTVLNLSRTVPSVVDTKTVSATAADGIARLAYDSYVTVSGSGATVFETNYGSTRSTASFKLSTTGANEKRKRKRDDEDASPPAKVEVVSSFAETGLIVGLSSNMLLGIQINDSLKAEGRPKSKGFLLVDLLSREGRMTAAKPLGTASEQAKRKENWQAWQTKVDQMIEEGDLEGLETLVAHDMGISKQQKATQQLAKQAEDGGETDGAQVVDSEDVGNSTVAWDLRGVSQTSRQDNLGKALYILGSMFGPALEELRSSSSIELLFLSPNILLWISYMGCFSTTSLQQALDRYPTLPAAGLQLQPHDFVAALLNFSNDFQILREVLNFPSRLELNDTIQILRLLVRSFDTTPSRPTSPFPLPTVGEMTAHNDDRTDPNTLSDPAALDAETSLAERDLEHAYLTLSHGLEARSSALHNTLNRLHAFPSADLIHAMRDQLSHQDLRFFINILRIELADGGWTRRYVDTAADPEDEDVESAADEVRDEKSRPLDSSISMIASLLNCAIDAVGTAGWLVGMSGSVDETAMVVETLASEIGAALEGCYQDFSLEGFLAELGRLAPLIDKEDKKIFADGEDAWDDATMMPLGGRSEALAMKAQGAKGKKNKKRAVVREKSRRVGEYEIDRIRF